MNLELGTKQFFRKFKAFFRGEEREYAPENSWNILVGFFFVGLLSAGTFAYFIFEWASETVSVTGAPKAEPEMVTLANIQAMVEHYDDRGKLHEG